MTSKLKTDVLETVSGSGTIVLNNQLSGMTSASMPSGSVVQVVHGHSSTAVSTGGSNFADTGLAATITPAYTSSKILVIVGQPMSVSTDTASARDVAFNIVRGTTEIVRGYGEVDMATSSRIKISISNCLNYLDSPSTTAATTYKTQFKVNAGSCDIYVNQHGGISTITLMEIKG